MTRAALLHEYEARKDQSDHEQVCKCCGKRSAKNLMEPHHPHGRNGEHILIFFWLHPRCHRWVHDHPALAKQAGLLEWKALPKERHDLETA